MDVDILILVGRRQLKFSIAVNQQGSLPFKFLENKKAFMPTPYLDFK